MLYLSFKKLTLAALTHRLRGLSPGVLVVVYCDAVIAFSKSPLGQDHLFP